MKIIHNKDSMKAVRYIDGMILTKDNQPWLISLDDKRMVTTMCWDDKILAVMRLRDTIDDFMWGDEFLENIGIWLL